MPTKPDPEEAQINADLTAAHAEHAAEDAAKAERDLAKAEHPGESLCPNCNGPLIEHGDENPVKAGAKHCNACGICWAPGLKHPR